MGKEFKILYWNINYKEGTAGKNRDNYKLASKICVDILKKYIDKENISAIVLTECYPQVNPDMKSYIYDYYRKNGSWKPNYAFEDYKGESDDILKEFEDRYDVFPYGSIDIGDIKKKGLPFMKMKYLKEGGRKRPRNWSYNPVVIICKKNRYELVGIKDCPNLLIIKDKAKDFYIAGFRVDNSSGTQKYIELAKEISKNIKYLSKSKVVVIGDFNPGNLESFKIEKGINSVIENGLVKDCRDNTTHISKPDKMLLINCNCEKDDFKVMENVKEYYKKEYPDLLYKGKNNCTIVRAPFPDHNLLFASIDLG